MQRVSFFTQAADKTSPKSRFRDYLRFGSRLSVFEFLLLLLVLLSCCLLLVPDSWMTRELNFHPSQFSANLSTDHTGETAIDWVDAGEQLWRCEFKSHDQSTYCGVVFTTVDEDWRGMDLSKFETLTIDAEYTGDASTLRIYLRNRSPSTYILDVPTSTKYNAVEIPVHYLTDGIPIQLDKFSVARWWIERRQGTPKVNLVEISDVIYLEIQTGTLDKANFVEMKVTNIELSGRLLTITGKYKLLAVVWTAAVILYLIFKVVFFAISLNKAKAYKKELISINKLLNLQNQQYENLANRDHLTGVLNRLGIRQVLLDGLRRWKEDGTPFSVILIDIDHFKQFNDVHGHDVGDRVLIHVADRLADNSAGKGFVARWGGEEFLVACPNTLQKNAESLAEELRRLISQDPVFDNVFVTASFGVAVLNNSNLEDTFEKADEALYRAKELGRNRVISASE